MEKINFGISLKNIPNTNRRNYFIKLIQKTEGLIRSMKWTAQFFLQRNNSSNEPDVYGFSSKKRRNRKIIWYTHPFNKMVTSKNINFLF